MEQSYKQKFYNTYAQLMPKMILFERERKGIKFWRVCKAWFINICYFGFWIYIFSTFRSVNIEAYLQLIPMTFAMLFLYIFVYWGITCNNSSDKNFSHDIKRVCFDDLIGVFDFIKPVKGYELPICKLYHKCTNKEGTIEPVIDDHFEGCYNDVKFKITEVSPLMMRGKMGCYSGPWRGVILNLRFNKTAKTKIFITPQSEKGSIIMICAGLFFCLLGIANLFFFLFSLFWTVLVVWSFFNQKKKRIDLEDNSFHKKYYAEADDQIEARYILTPSFMERLKNLEIVFDSKNIRCMIDGNYITFAIQTKRDLFEIGDINIPMSDSRQVRTFYDEITAICNIIDHFKLNERTGL